MGKHTSVQPRNTAMFGTGGILPRAKNEPPARFCGILPPPCSNPAAQIRYQRERGRQDASSFSLVGVAGLLPRAKNVPPARFCGILPPPCSNPATQIRYQKRKRTQKSVHFLFWSEWRDSNPRPLGPEPSAIPNFATPRSDDYYSGMRMKSQVLFSEKPLILF